MKKVIRLTESDLFLIVKRVIKESKRNIFEDVSQEKVSQENVKRAYTDFVNSVSGLGTDEEGIKRSVESLSSKEEFLAFLELFKGGESGYNSFQSAINGEFEDDNIDDVLELKNLIEKKFGVEITPKKKLKSYIDPKATPKTTQTPAKPQTSQPAQTPAKPQTSQPAQTPANKSTSTSKYVSTNDTDFATAFNTDKKIMTYGSKGNLVKKVQNFLLKSGFVEPNLTKDIEGCKKDSNLCDGVYGKGTSNAVRKFQTNKGLKGKDGIVGGETAKSMGLI